MVYYRTSMAMGSSNGVFGASMGGDAWECNALVTQGIKK